jgi:protein tyrosine phosphatase
MLEAKKQGNAVDIYNTVRKLRKQRVQMVQSVEQYILLHEIELNI